MDSDSKAHLEQIIAQSKLEVSATAKPWEPYRSYDRRLTALKDKGESMPYINVLVLA